MLVHGVQITLVPWLLDSSELIYGRRSRPLLGDDRRDGRLPSYGLVAHTEDELTASEAAPSRRSRVGCRGVA
jgi:hypothetical protein